ncbi:uridylate kinase [Apostasia shenzhenica]|uniref:UMP kinase n=1 Tax=Apostasia shenzhenica TaxID=1088818 RepID=A0A2I0AA88_9ASPA|nr:uridylate kinase [Apostasia shenzhenica]
MRHAGSGNPNPNPNADAMPMASCDDDFALLGDEAQSQAHSQQQASAAVAAAAAAAAASVVSFSTHRYMSKAAVPIHARSLPISSIASPKKGQISAIGEDEDHEGYGEAFTQTEVNHNHCFASDGHGSNPFVPPQPPENDDADGDTESDRKFHAAAAVASTSHHHHHQQQEQQQQYASRLDPKRNERDELSDGESPYGYNTGSKRSRHSSAAPSSSGDYRKDREEWSDSAIGCLLDAYSEKYIQLNRGNLRGRDWEDVATTVSERCEKQKSGKSVEQCKNKVDNLKKRYKVECQRISSGNLAVSHWPWFKKMEQIVGSSSSKAAPEEDRAVAVGDSSPAAKQMKRYPVNSPGSANLTNNFKLKSLSNPRWKRVVLKISGVALAGTGPQNVDPKVMMLIAREVGMANRVGVEAAIVVGGRNFFCGDTWIAATVTDRATTYQIGMMASAMNAILLQASFEKIGIDARVQTAFTMQEIAEPYIRRRAVRHLEKGRVVIFGGIGAGTGNPLFTADTAAALRALEINADAILKGTTDGVYDCHSRTNSSVFEHISFRELASRGFTEMDMTAVTFCEENNIPVVLFNLMEPGNISRALCGDQVGTLVDQAGSIS